jgi:DNA-binding transcriptional ArsR family regulator
MGIDAALAALSDPTRRDLVEVLGRRPARAGDLAQRFPISRPAVSKHLRVLREAGLVDAEDQGRERIYYLVPHGLDEVKKWMDRASRMWDDALDSFKRYAEGGRDDRS